jgi:hypothetical protein
MEIQIKERWKVYSHRIGGQCYLPGSPYILTIYPTHIAILQIEANLIHKVASIDWELQGPVHNFTYALDLDRERISVWGEAKQGYFHYTIRALLSPLGLEITLDRALAQGISYQLTYNHPYSSTTLPKSALLQRKEKIIVTKNAENCPSTIQYYQVQNCQTLSFGFHKALEWENILRRNELSELIPIWFRLTQLLPPMIETIANLPSEGAFTLLKNCYILVQQGEKLALEQELLNLFNYSIKDLGVSQLEDTYFQGINCPPLSAGNHLTGLHLLKSVYHLLLMLFIKTVDSSIHILPTLLPSFKAGRALNLPCGLLGTIDMEWRKDSIRRVYFHANTTQTIHFVFPSFIKSYRLGTGNKQMIKKQAIGLPLNVIAGQTYSFDYFEK